MMSIAAKKHDGYQSLTRTSLQVHYGILTDSIVQRFKLIATKQINENKMIITIIHSTMHELNTRNVNIYQHIKLTFLQMEEHQQ